MSESIFALNTMVLCSVDENLHLWGCLWDSPSSSILMCTWWLQLPLLSWDTAPVSSMCTPIMIVPDHSLPLRSAVIPCIFSPGLHSLHLLHKCCAALPSFPSFHPSTPAFCGWHTCTLLNSGHFFPWFFVGFFVFFSFYFLFLVLHDLINISLLNFLNLVIWICVGFFY